MGAVATLRRPSSCGAGQQQQQPHFLRTQREDQAQEQQVSVEKAVPFPPGYDMELLLLVRPAESEDFSAPR